MIKTEVHRSGHQTPFGWVKYYSISPDDRFPIDDRYDRKVVTDLELVYVIALLVSGTIH